MAKQRKGTFVCSECGNSEIGYYGKCPKCGAYGTMEEVQEAPAPPKNKIAATRVAGAGKSEQLKAVVGGASRRFNTGNSEFDRVLGGGVVVDSVNIFTAPPGMGKSTLLLQIANSVADLIGNVIYIAGEESKSQIKNRADRILSGGISDNLFIQSDTMLESILSDVKTLSPVLIIVDSVQMLYSAECDGVLGRDKQISHCVGAILNAAKNGASQFSAFLIGQMTKEDELRGSREVEHMVDGVFSLERIDSSPIRILRATKNRFGDADEVGMFEMDSSGLNEIADPTHYFISSIKGSQVGSALTVLREGTRNIVIEIESMVESNTYSYPQRIINGFNKEYAQLLLAVIENQLKKNMSKRDVYLQISGGLRTRSPHIALATCASIYSVATQIPISRDTLFIGEVGLTGNVKRAPDINSIVRDCSRFGFSNIVMPSDNLPLKTTSSVNIIPISRVSELKNIII